MKKYSLLKAIGIIVIVFMFLTWMIPASVFVENKFINDGYNPMGLFDLVLLPFKFFDWSNSVKMLQVDNVSIEFISYTGNLLALLSIGVFYKVLNKTGAYGILIERVVKLANSNKIVFSVLSIIFFTLLSALTGLSLLLFALLPFFITILLQLKFSRVTALATTVLPILVGRVCSITAWDVTGINNVVYGIEWNDNLILRIIILVMFLISLIAYVVLSKSPADDVKDDPLYDGFIKKEKSYVPMLVLSGLFFVIIGVCMYNWYYVFGFSGVTDAYNNIVANSINGYPFVVNLLGTLEPFGYWSGFTMSAFLLVLSGLIAFMYSVSLDTYIDAFKSGIKAMVKPVLYVVLASLVLVFIGNKSANIFYTMSNWINTKINLGVVPFSTLSSGIYGIFVNDYTAVALQSVGVLGEFFVDGAYALSVLAFQVIYGIVSIVTPTSIFLVAGLSYLGISYKKWLFYIWKFFLALFSLAFLILLIASLI